MGLSPKGENNGLIYVTEGIGNDLSIQEHLNNEVRCSMSPMNFLKLPYQNNKRYVFIFDNDDNKQKQNGRPSTLDNIIKQLREYEGIKKYGQNYAYDNSLKGENPTQESGRSCLDPRIRGNDINEEENNSEESGENNRKESGNKYYFFYLKSPIPGQDVNDLLRENKLPSIFLRPM
jgi:hypothetical protein